MLATAVLLAACVHNTDDFTLFVAESGASLTYYIGSDAEKGEKDDDDPWDTILEKFFKDSTHGGVVNKENTEPSNDPWDTINESFGRDTNHTGEGKTGAGSWERIRHLFPGKFRGHEEESDRSYCGVEKSEAVFLLFDDRMPSTYRARVAEVRGRVGRLAFTDGAEQYVVDMPVSWEEGTQLETGFAGATNDKDRPFLGVRFWRVIVGSNWADNRILRTEKSSVR